MRIIGITGTLGAGKGTVVDYLVREKSFTYYSSRSFITEEILRRGLAVSRDTMVSVANNLARLHGPDYIARELCKQAQERGRDAVIESLRRPGEIATLRGFGDFVLFAVDANPEIRYKRIMGRGSETDAVSFEKFLSDEERESVSDDPNVQNLPKCIALADVLLTNNGTREDLYRQIDAALEAFIL